MQFEGFPSPEILHADTLQKTRIALHEELSFDEYVLQSLRLFSGVNAVPRLICGVVTQEYITFVMRPGLNDTVEAVVSVSDTFRTSGFYVEVNNGPTARASGTVSFLISWDPAVLQNSHASRRLVEDNTYQQYLMVMQYVRAERSLTEISKYPKDSIQIGKFNTKKWVSISILSVDMYREILPVCEVLWDFGYYVGLSANRRREETWTLFVCWDHVISKERPEHDILFSFRGTLPDTWI